MNSQSLLDRVERLEKKVAQLERQNLALHKENTGLKRRLLAYENAHTPPSKTKRKREPKEPGGKIGASVGHEKWQRQQPE
ncbi:MAG: hypothetical protein ABID38_00445, partial [Candidatus Diapherotrites archaeon]